MRLFTTLPALVAAVAPVAAHDHDNHQTTATSASTGIVTSSAMLACATGDAQSKYESCSKAISSRMEGCDEDDLGCACSLANSGFNCLTSYCHSHTSAVCMASALLGEACSMADEPGPTFTDYTCPKSVTNVFESMVPSAINSFLTFLSSVEGTSSRSSTAKETRSSTTGATAGALGTGSISAPSSTGAAGAASRFGGYRVGIKRGVKDDPLKAFLGLGIFFATVIAGLAAYL